MLRGCISGEFFRYKVGRSDSPCLNKLIPNLLITQPQGEYASKHI